MSGKLKLSEVFAKEIDIHSVSGEINLQNITGNLNIETLSGDTYVKYKEFDNNVNINSVSSSIKIDLPRNSEFKVEKHLVSGTLEYRINGVKQSSIKNSEKNILNIDSMSSHVVINEYDI